MIFVYVWEADGENSIYGHASMAVGDEHISWWPDMDFEDVPFVGTYADIKSYDEEVAEENGPPHHVVAISGLDERAILDWWKKLKSEVWYSSWNKFSFNCATVVAAALEIGGGSERVRWWNYLATWNWIWTPADVLSYALAIRDTAR